MLPLLLLSQVVVSFAAPATENIIKCDVSKVNITGGGYILNENDKTVEYTCPGGKYPYPAPKRTCLQSELWEKQNVKAVCKDVQCPGPVEFENGEYSPRKTEYTVGDVLNFECWVGYEMKGSENRTCQVNGKWSGKTTICDDRRGHCPSPGIPFGSSKVGISYEVESTVEYQCRAGLEMHGSKERECLANGQWSGTEPSCRAGYTYDTPEEVAETFSSSFSAVMEGADPDQAPDTVRKIVIKEGGNMNIFIILDASKSVKKEDFNIAKESAKLLIEKITQFSVAPRYAIISFASRATEVVRLSDDDSWNADSVIEKLDAYKYEYHGDKRGTNTRAALAAVHQMLVLQELKDKENFLKTPNVILLMTDGKYNMGGDPRVEMKRIRNLLDNGTKDKPQEDYLDVYVFGLGEGIDNSELNDLASKKDREKHLFVLKDVQQMKEAFDSMIDDTDAMDMCGLNKESDDVFEQFPWIAEISITRAKSAETCKGSILTQDFILTAAHCFHFDEDPRSVIVEVGDQGDRRKTYRVKTIYRHPSYKPESKQDKNITKSFDYDFSILELKRKLAYSSRVRPICLPCTKSSSWALRTKGEGTKCKEHKDILFKVDRVNALFIAEETNRNLEQKNVKIKTGKTRAACLEAAKNMKEFADVADIRDVVTDQFLCTGGTEPTVEPPTCKGDSGGPLMIEYKKRFIQVGVRSWGTVNHCKGTARLRTPVPANSRDFHVSVFPMLSWIQEIVGEQLTFFTDLDS